MKNITNQQIRELLMFFTENYRKYGNIFGFGLENYGYIEEIKPAATCLFFSADTVLCGLKYLLLKRMIEDCVEFPTVEYYRKVLGEISNDDIAKEGFHEIMSRTRNLLHKINPDVGFFFYDRSLDMSLYVNGLDDVFYEENRSLIRFLQEDKVNSVVVYAPSDYLALRLLFNKYNVKIKIIHLLEFISSHVDELEVRGNRAKFVLQESCIINRWLGKKSIYDVLHRIGGIDIYTHPLSGDLTVCCGEYLWLTRPLLAIRNATERLKGLIHMGSTSIIVACPSALFLFRLATKFCDECPEDIQIYDISEVLLKLLEG